MKKLFLICCILILTLIAAIGSSCQPLKSTPAASLTPSGDGAPLEAEGGNADGATDETTFVPTVDFSNKTYCAYGDSITWGYSYRESNHRMEKPYPTLVSELLGLASYTNNAISGATLTANPFELFNETSLICSVTTPYDIISVLMGVNDYNRSLPLGTASDTDNSTFYGSLYMIMEHFRTSYPNSFVFFMTPFNLYLDSHNGYTNNSQGYNLGDISNAIKSMASKYGYPVLDLLAVGNYESEMTTVDSDGIHPSQEFFQNYTAPQIARFINDHFEE